MKYNPNEIEARWQKYWAENKTFAAENHSGKPKYYVLDMFPYPSGAGLHVGHPLGYIASDIYARFKRHQGFNVLHPQGYDSFGLPAEQYAIQTGQHPEKTTRENIARYREQLDKIGFSFDWDREVRTSDPDYYKWTQWIFIQLFNSWYNQVSDRAESICTLIGNFEEYGNANIKAVSDDNIEIFSAGEWKNYTSEKQQQILLQYRLTYLAETEVNWCPGLGTVLANDEIVNGVSERGGFPVIRKKMTQWSMRISAYAERLLQGLNDIDWTQSLKDAQTNWIGKSIGAEIVFEILTPNPSPKERGTTPKYMTGNPEIAKTLVAHAKSMRKDGTDAEILLWDALRNRKLGDKFRRQHPIGNYIADFVCLEKRLIVEVDGGYHRESEQLALDEERQFELEQKHSYKVIRYTNEEVINNLARVIAEIGHELGNRKSHMDVGVPLSFGEGLGVRIFTTRPDTIFGVTFLTLAPEHELVSGITSLEQQAAVSAYIEATAKRSERERMADVKTISGVFTGAYATHPFTGEAIPIWIGDYVLAGYGTGAVMAVPAGDQRDYDFAKHFDIAIQNIFSLDSSPAEGWPQAAYTDKYGFTLQNSGFLNGLNYKEATARVVDELENISAGKGKTNYRLRDAVFSRQRYWGEPFPVYYVNGLPQLIDAQHLPIRLPEVEKYLPTEDGAPPLGNATVWAWDTVNNKVVSTDLISSPLEGSGQQTIFPLELNTMPGWAGSSWYWLRYMDPHNSEAFVSKEAEAYWQNVDLYIGGSEHATGHLLYSRFWNKFLKDRGFVTQDEPFKKLINQGMILGMSAFAYKVSASYSINGAIYIIELDKPIIVTKSVYDSIQFFYNNVDKVDVDRSQYYRVLKVIQQDNCEKFKEEPNFSLIPFHIDISMINDISGELDIDRLRQHSLYQDYQEAIFISEDNGKFIVSREVEKMSKSKYNVVTPDDICEEYGADTLRLYEMFLGPLEQAKPWNTAGITGVFGFLKKLWRLYFDDGGLIVTANPASKEALKTLHKTIRKVQDDIEGFSFNTSVSQFMIAVNELTAMNCHERSVLEPLAILVSPYAPHIAEELWHRLGHGGSVSTVPFPKFNPEHLVESSKEYPVSFNGKTKFTIELPLDLKPVEIEEIILNDERTIAQLAGTTPKKVIIVPGKIINLVG